MLRAQPAPPDAARSTPPDPARGRSPGVGYRDVRRDRSRRDRSRPRRLRGARGAGRAGRGGMVVRRRPDRCVADPLRRGGRPSRRRRSARRGERGRGRCGRRDRPDRGSSPRDRLAVHLSAGRPAVARRAFMRFQDAARDARAVVYAGIQADPQVARTAALLADATDGERLLARAVMNGETSDPDVWRVMFPTLFGVGATTDAADAVTSDRSEAILTASLAVAD